MGKLLDTILRLKILKDSLGQELVEYTLLAGFLVTICAATSPAVATDVSTVITHIASTLNLCANNSGQIGN